MIKVKLVKQGSGVYTITIPKAIVEAHSLYGSDFNLEISGTKIILTKGSNKK